MQPPPIKPQSVDELLAWGFKLYIAGFRDILGILLTQTVSILVLFILLFYLTISFFDSSSSSFLQTRFITSLVLSTLLILAVQLGFIASFTAKCWALIHNTTITTRHAYAVGLQKALPLLAWLILYLFVVAVGALLLVVPGLILLISLFMGGALIIQGHYTTFNAFIFSHKLVWPYLRRTLLYLFVAIAITLLAYFITIYPLGMFVAYLTNDNPLLSGIIAIARYVLIIMLAPLFVALIIPYYMDLLVRHKSSSGKN